MEVTTKKQNRRKIVIGVLIAVVVLVAAVIVFASSYLVNYAIGRSGDGGDREVALDVEAPTDGVEQLIAENRAVQKQANEEFLQQNPGQTVQITAADGLRLNGVYYPNTGSHLWVIALHGYRGSHTGVTNLAQHYHDAGYQVLTPDLRACGDSEGDYVGMGWLAVAAFIPLKRAIGWGGLGMLLAGGIVYTIGAVIYALKKPNLAILKSFGFHEIFHVFVMLGSAFHIAFMFLYVL